MEFYEVIRERFTCKKFDSRPVAVSYTHLEQRYQQLAGCQRDTA